MRAVLTGLWKEWRDQRGMVLAVLIALPVLVLSAAWAFGGKVAAPQFAGLALLVLPSAQALFLIAVASELFGSERRRGTLALVQRLPAGLGRSLASKLLGYALGTLLSLAWGAVVGVVACVLFGPAGAAGEMLMRLGAAEEALLPLLIVSLFVFGCWVLLLSTWVPQGGAAVLGAALLLGLLALPTALLLQDHVWLVARTAAWLAQDGGARLVLPFSELAGAALLALAVSHLRGQRRLASAWSPAWRGLALVGVLAAGGYAYGAVVVARELDVDPAAASFRMQDVFVAEGGRYAYVNAHAGEAPWWQYREENRGRFDFGTPIKPFLVDLTDGSARAVGEFGEGWVKPWYGGYESQQLPASHVLHCLVDGQQVTWYDAPKGQPLKTVWHTLENDEIRAWRRSVRAQQAWHRDAEGRALWVDEDGAIVREGDALPPATTRRTPPAFTRAIPGGWVVTRYSTQGQSGFTLEAATGRKRAVPSAKSARGESLREFLSPRHLLVHAKGAPAIEFAVLDLDASDAPQRVEAPAGFAWVGGPTEDGRVLCRAGSDRRRTALVLWSPLSGASAPLQDAQGRELTAYECGLEARAPGDRMVLSARQDPASAASVLLLVDGRAGTARSLPVRGNARNWVCLKDGELLAVEDSRRLVRYGADGSRTVLFPRPRD